MCNWDFSLALLWWMLAFLGSAYFCDFDLCWTTGWALSPSMVCVNFAMRSQGRGVLGDSAQHNNQTPLCAFAFSVV